MDDAWLTRTDKTIRLQVSLSGRSTQARVHRPDTYWEASSLNRTLSRTRNRADTRPQGRACMHTPGGAHAGGPHRAMSICSI